MNPGKSVTPPGCPEWQGHAWKWMCLATALAMWLGCRRAEHNAAQTASEAARPARSSVERGPVRLTVEVAPSPARLSDDLKLTVTLDYVQGVRVRKPAFGQALGDFLIRDFHEPLPKTQGQREVIQQIYTLEPTRPGKISLDPIRVSFVDARPAGDGQERKIETEAVGVEIASVVAGDVPRLEKLRALAGPVELPHSRTGGIRWWIAAGAALLAAVAALRLRKRRRTAQEEPLSPQELAYLEFQRLVEEDWARRDVKQFYVELTGIVRRYIERTTSVRAAEQTTEEFLKETSRQAVFAPEDRQRLQSFLESADLVKFAAFHPQSADIEESFRRAKRFVGLEELEVAA